MDFDDANEYYQELIDAINSHLSSIIDHSDITTPDIKVGHYLLQKCCNEKRYISVSLDEMSKNLRLSKSTIITAINHLEVLDFFIVKRDEEPHRYIPQFPAEIKELLQEYGR